MNFESSKSNESVKQKTVKVLNITTTQSFVSANDYYLDSAELKNYTTSYSGYLSLPLHRQSCLNQPVNVARHPSPVLQKLKSASFKDITIIKRLESSVSFYISLSDEVTVPFFPKNKEAEVFFMKSMQSVKHKRAAMRRSFFLHERKVFARVHNDCVKNKVSILRVQARQHLRILKSRHESRHELATRQRKRQINERIDTCTRKNEHAITVSIKQKIERMHARLSVSMNIHSHPLNEAQEGEYDTESLRCTSPVDSVDSDSTFDEEIEGALDKITLSAYDLASIRAAAVRETLGRRALINSELSTEDFETLEPSNYAKEFSDLLPRITRFSLHKLIIRFSLQELNIDEILSNPQLRHDLYFDPNLSFKPNLEGQRGSRKRAESDTYWITVSIEIESGSYFRVPLILFEIKYILLDLLPEDSILSLDLEGSIDAGQIAQEIQHDVFDAIKFSRYLGNVLLLNCAPARDDKVKQMILKAEDGEFAQFLRQCFEILELMKLDNANHQLSRLRGYVVENAISYELRFFKARFNTKIPQTRNWLAKTRQSIANRTSRFISILPPRAESHFNIVYHLAMVENMILDAVDVSSVPFANRDNSLPETFQLDLNHVISLYNDITDATLMSSLIQLYRNSCKPAMSSLSTVSDLKRDLWVLLNDQGISLKHCALYIAKKAGTERNREFTPKETEDMITIIEKTLEDSETGPLYKLMQKRIGSALLANLFNGSEKFVLADSSLVDFTEELGDQYKRIKKLCDFNLSVYRSVHAKLWNEISSEV